LSYWQSKDVVGVVSTADEVGDEAGLLNCKPPDELAPVDEDPWGNEVVRPPAEDAPDEGEDSEDVDWPPLEVWIELCKDEAGAGMVG
jgi:hypothetical protein